MVNKTGSTGQPVDLYTNYLGFSKCPDQCLYKYRVDFKSNQGELETYLKKKLFSRLAARLPPYLFDGSMLYLPSKVTELNYTSSIEGGGAPVPIELRLISELHPTDNDYVHVSAFNYFPLIFIRMLTLQKTSLKIFFTLRPCRKVMFQFDTFRLSLELTEITNEFVRSKMTMK